MIRLFPWNTFLEVKFQEKCIHNLKNLLIHIPTIPQKLYIKGWLLFLMFSNSIGQKLSFFLSFKNNFYWDIVDLQCCVSFRCIAKWISFTDTYICSFLRLFSHIGHYRVWSRDPCASSRFFSGIYFMYRNVSVLPSLPVYLSPSLSPNNHKFVLYICDSACFVN